MFKSKRTKRSTTSNRISGSKSTRPNPISRLSASNEEQRRRLLDVVHLMRQDPARSLRSAAREAGLTPNRAIQLGRSGFEKSGQRYRVRPYDRLRRDLIFYDPKGQITLTTHSSKAASEIGRYHNAVRAYLIYGDDSALQEFEGKSVAVDGQRFPYITDRRTLNRLARAGELNFLEIYRDGGGI